MDNRIKDNILNLLNKKDKIIIAIEGPCTSGKTTLSKEISEEFDCNVIHMDDFFLPFEKRTPERFSEIGGNIDYERFSEEIIESIRTDSAFTYGKFDCSSGTISEKITVEPKKLIVVEGVYCMHPKFGDIYDFRIFLDITDETKISRLKKRSPEKLDRFINDWIPKENLYFETYKIKEKCDLVIDNN